MDFMLLKKKAKERIPHKKSTFIFALNLFGDIAWSSFAYCRFMIINVLVWDFTVITIALVYTMLLTACIVHFQYYVRRKEKEEERPTTEN